MATFKPGQRVRIVHHGEKIEAELAGYIGMEAVVIRPMRAIERAYAYACEYVIKVFTDELYIASEMLEPILDEGLASWSEIESHLPQLETEDVAH